MSTFKGFIKELDGISIDHFLAENLSASVFFLSHTHTDHMKGLLPYLGNREETNKTLRRLGEDGIYLYSSPTTTKILQVMYPEYQTNFIALDIGVSKLLVIPSTMKSITVTLIPANHCPGSVMILFEAQETILYTGDFRWKMNQSLPKALCYNTGRTKKIDIVYLDTTFFYEKYKQFPSREESIKKICSIIKEWIDRGENYVVWLDTSAKYGYESLFCSIVENVNCPIHVHGRQYSVYCYFPHMDKAVTNYSTQIHCHCGNKWDEICSSFTNIRYIRVSAMIWKDWKVNDDLSTSSNGDFKVCYSCHSSFEEINNFLDALKPLQVIPNVIDRSHRKELFENINKFYDRHGNSSKNIIQTEVFSFSNRVILEEDMEEEVECSDFDLLD